MPRDGMEFFGACLLRVMSKAGSKVPRPLSMTLHACKPNQIIHSDYLLLGTNSTDEMYALLLKDILSGYCWLESRASGTRFEDGCEQLPTT